MINIKDITKYIIAFFIALFIVLLSLLTLLKTTIYNKDYIKDTLQKSNYFKLVSDSIDNNMKDYMVSSGIDESVLNDLYTKEEIKEDIFNYIDNVYNGSLVEFNENKIKQRLTDNINNYYSSKNITISDKKAVDDFVNNMSSIYKSEIRFYDTLNNYIKLLKKSQKIITISIIILVGLVVIPFAYLVYKRFNYIGIIMSSGGLMLLFIRYMVYNRIDYNNVLIVSDNFSLILRKVLNDIANQMTIYAYTLLVIGLLTSLLISIYKPNKKHKKIKGSK